MSPEDKLQLGISRLREKRVDLNKFESDILAYVESELRKDKIYRRISPKQKSVVYQLLKKHNCEVN
tara:strand:+ start:340 stop:537 length:198 start_codon:yes stop_codon:yes gene_type:complete